MIAIALEGIHKTYPGAETAAIKELSITIEEGSIVTLLGPSGCGKTTTLRLIAGFERAEKGRIILAGKTVSDELVWLPPEKRGVGMVFQDYALFPHLTVEKNIAFGYTKKNKQKRVKEVLELVGLAGYEKRYPHELSGGQQQRVALARALARKPIVVLLDEPFSNLDADLRTQMRMEVKRIIKEAGATAVLVSHDQKDALAISDRIIVMKDGNVQQEGTPREIYQYPENRFVATFVGQTNIISGVIGHDGKTVDTEYGKVPCRHTHDHQPGDRVDLSIRPDSLELDTHGTISGTVKQATYTGESVDVVLSVPLAEGKDRELLTHIHPEKVIAIGEKLTFRILPEFVAVINQE